MTKTYLNRLVISCLVLSVSACSWFDSSDDDEREPYPLQKINEEVTLKKLWSKRIGEGTDGKYQRFVAAIDNDRLFAAGSDGFAFALSPDNGKEIWKTSLRSALGNRGIGGLFSGESYKGLISGGVGVGNDLVVVATNTGHIAALNQSDGVLAWKAEAPSEILAAPQINEDILVAQSIDGVLTGYDPMNGVRKWTYTASVPRLTLRGTSTPLLLADSVIGGFANGRVALLDIERGIPQWEQKVAIGQGESELERLVDIDGIMINEGSRLYVASYQGQLVGMDVTTGKIGWQKEASSFVGLGSGFGNVYLSSDESVITAFDMSTGKEVWRVDALTYRDITAAAAVGNYIAVGDLEGYVHLIAQSDGRFVGRQKVDGKGINSTILASGNNLYVMGNSGKLTALSIR
jgi:outer membrane protein assembly factor BamB